jgi:hypothetical protein
MFAFLPSHYKILPLLHALGFEGYNLTLKKKKALLLLLIVICSVCLLDISSPQCVILLGLFPLSIVNCQRQWAHMVLKISIPPQWYICHKESEQKENLIIPLTMVLFGIYFCHKESC